MRIRVQEHKQWSNSTVMFLLTIIFCLCVSLFLCMTAYLKHNPALSCKDYAYGSNNRKVCLIPEEDIN